MSQCTVAAPAVRASAASRGPPVATMTPGRAKRSRQNVTEPSAKSIHAGGCGSATPQESSAGFAAAEPTSAAGMPSMQRAATMTSLTIV